MITSGWWRGVRMRFRVSQYVHKVMGTREYVLVHII